MLTAIGILGILSFLCIKNANGRIRVQLADLNREGTIFVEILLLVPVLVYYKERFCSGSLPWSMYASRSAFDQSFIFGLTEKWLFVM
jgi:hypothetical protein